MKQPVKPTGDGRRLRVDELNLSSSEEDLKGSRWQRFRRGLALFLAGLYTGESCAGTPHSERRIRDQPAGQEGVEDAGRDTRS